MHKTKERFFLLSTTTSVGDTNARTTEGERGRSGDSGGQRERDRQTETQRQRHRETETEW